MASDHLPKGTPVTWHFHDAVQHGYVESWDGTEYLVRQVDNHVASDGPRVAYYHHLPSALTVTTRAAVEAAANDAIRRRSEHPTAQGTKQMATTDTHGFRTLTDGTHVSWPYRGTRGHGIIRGIHHLGTNHDTTEYSIEELDHHVSDSGPHEAAIVYHYGRVLTVESA